ncbi:MAG: hypothetical protein AAFR52_20270, partial [Pseudomonadota bacterium]
MGADCRLHPVGQRARVGDGGQVDDEALEGVVAMIVPVVMPVVVVMIVVVVVVVVMVVIVVVVVVVVVMIVVAVVDLGAGGEIVLG